MINNHVAVNRIESNRIESNRIESDRIESNRIGFGRERRTFLPKETNCANETRRVISFFFFLFLFLFFVVAHPSIIKYRSSRCNSGSTRDFFVQGMKNSRSREIFPRNANYLRWRGRWDTNPSAGREGGRKKRECGRKRGGVIDARLPETSASADARAFFSLSDAKIAPRSLHGRGFCRDCSTVRRPFD